jgi:VIT1/CCC1 family predicted Fe2+/Mn2+ transporter
VAKQTVGTTAWRRNVVIGVLLAILILVVQLLTTHSWAAALISAVLAFLVTLLVLWVSDRYSSR